jgi:hypothetical protein
MKSLLDLFKQFTPDEHFDAIRIGWRRPKRSVHGLLAKSRSPKPSTTAPSSLSVTAVLRQDLWPHQGLRMPVRQVQAPEAPRRHLREVRR